MVSIEFFLYQVSQELTRTFSDLDAALIAIFLTLLVFLYTDPMLRKVFRSVNFGNRVLEFVLLAFIYVIVVPVLVHYAQSLILGLEVFRRWVVIAALVIFDFISYSYLLKINN